MTKKTKDNEEETLLTEKELFKKQLYIILIEYISTYMIN